MINVNFKYSIIIKSIENVTKYTCNTLSLHINKYIIVFILILRVIIMSYLEIEL